MDSVTLDTDDVDLLDAIGRYLAKASGDEALERWLRNDNGQLAEYIHDRLTGEGVRISAQRAEQIASGTVRRILSGSTPEAALHRTATALVPLKYHSLIDDALQGAPVNVVDTVAEEIQDNIRIADGEANGALQWQWVTQNDDDVCPDCEELDGNVYDIDEPFDKVHINCRCYPVTLRG